MCKHENHRIELHNRLVVVRCSSCPVILRYDEITRQGDRIRGITMNRLVEMEKENSH